MTDSVYEDLRKRVCDLEEVVRLLLSHQHLHLAAFSNTTYGPLGMEDVKL